MAADLMQVEKNLEQKTEIASTDAGHFSEANATDAASIRIDLRSGWKRQIAKNPLKIPIIPIEITAREHGGVDTRL